MKVAPISESAIWNAIGSISKLNKASGTDIRDIVSLSSDALEKMEVSDAPPVVSYAPQSSASSNPGPQVIAPAAAPAEANADPHAEPIVGANQAVAAAPTASAAEVSATPIAPAAAPAQAAANPSAEPVLAANQAELNIPEPPPPQMVEEAPPPPQSETIVQPKTTVTTKTNVQSAASYGPEPPDIIKMALELRPPFRIGMDAEQFSLEAGGASLLALAKFLRDPIRVGDNSATYRPFTAYL